MDIRRAAASDIDGILSLLSQVLEVHAKIRPDIFILGTTKYTKDELNDIIADDSRPIYVGVENGKICGYAFCIIETAGGNAMHPRKTVYIDDLCVDAAYRGKGIGKEIFLYVKSEAKRLGFDDITLSVWQGNDPAYEFYKKMGMTPRKTVMELEL